METHDLYWKSETKQKERMNNMLSLPLPFPKNVSHLSLSYSITNDFSPLFQPLMLISSFAFPNQSLALPPPLLCLHFLCGDTIEISFVNSGGTKSAGFCLTFQSACSGLSSSLLLLAALEVKRERQNCLSLFTSLHLNASVKLVHVCMFVLCQERLC